jgi:hypothetical protein
VDDTPGSMCRRGLGLSPTYVGDDGDAGDVDKVDHVLQCLSMDPSLLRRCEKTVAHGDQDNNG